MTDAQEFSKDQVFSGFACAKVWRYKRNKTSFRVAEAEVNGDSRD